MASCLQLVVVLALAAPCFGYLFPAFKKCYGDLGCFAIDGDFVKRPVQLLPSSPEKLRTRFLLNTRENSAPSMEDPLKYTEEFSVKRSHFKPSRKTKIIVHGFTDNGGDDWLVKMMKEFLIKDDFNVIRVDWRIGARIPYELATANTRVVGAEIALLVQRICRWTGAVPQDFHILGHSLGSHISGYAGERIEGLGRITGLDPAEPYFQGYGPGVRLDPTDANYVDVIHSDASAFWDVGGAITQPDKGLGMLDPVGHIDFYPNNGMKQPGCKKSLVKQIIGGILDISSIISGDQNVFDVVACSHMRSIYLYTESINSPCPFYAYRCPSYDAFLQGLCMNCGLNNTRCATMGHHADDFIAKLKPGEENVKMFLVTGAEVPRCRYNYLVEVDLAAGLGLPQAGLLSGNLIGDRASASDVVFSAEEQQLTPGTPYRYLKQSTEKIGNPQKVEIWWKYIWSMKDPTSWPTFRKPQIYVKSVMCKTDTSEVKVENHKTGKNSIHFCAHKVPVKPGKLQSAVFFPSTESNGLCSD